MAFTVAKYSVDIEDSIGYAGWMNLKTDMFMHSYGTGIGADVDSDLLLAVL